jgi:hypothetical protein
VNAAARGSSDASLNEAFRPPSARPLIASFCLVAVEIFIVVVDSATKDLGSSVTFFATKKWHAQWWYPPPRIGIFRHWNSVFIPT